jgi:hypothetical protein
MARDDATTPMPAHIRSLPMNRPVRIPVLTRLVTLALLLGLLASVQIAPAAGVSAGSPQQSYCGIRWGSLPKNHLVSTYTTATIENLRAGRHGCFDRLVVDLGPRWSGLPGGQGNGYQIRYGPAVPSIEGGVILSVLLNAAAHDDDYQPTYQPRDPDHAVDVTGFRTFRQVTFLGTFEAQTEIAIGVRARLPFRAFVLSGPGSGSRFVIDVAHRW